MTPESLLRQFDVVADAPNGVKKLRELILQLAVRGKLVPQDPDDEPASVLLERIAAEKARLIAKGKIGKPKTLPPISEGEVPFEVPEGWTWVRLHTISDQRLGKMLDSGKNKGELYPYLRNTNVQWLRFDLEDVKEMRFRPDELDEYEVRPGDLLICEGGEPGRCAVWSGGSSRMMFQKALHRVRPNGGIDVRYILHNLRTSAFSGTLDRHFTGATIKHLTGQSLAQLLLPLPPLAEQHRIVAKVDELMALCDELEARQQRLAEVRVRLNRSALHHLTSASDDAELAAHWERLRENFHLIYDTPESVAELRQAVLQLAVRGKLVPQDPDDEPASVLLERIAAGKKRLVAEGKIGKQKVLPPIGADEVPFEVPEGWMWVRIGEIAAVIGGIQKSPSRAPVASHYPYLRVANVQRGALLLSEIERFELSVEELARWRLEPGDLLIVEGNGSETEIGRCARWNGEIADCVHQNHLIRVRPTPSDTGVFILRYLNSPDGKDEMRRLAVTTSGLFNLSVGKINTIVVPLPPLAEQHRIVAKVDELMTLCDELDGRLTSARESSARLAAAVVHQLTMA